MASIDKAAIVFSIAIALVGVGIAAMGSAVDNSPAAPTQQMSANTDAAEAAAEARAEARAEAAAVEAAADKAAADKAAAAKAAAAKAAAVEAAAAPKTVIVDIPTGTSVPGCETTNACFSPAMVSINAGDTVEWVNEPTAAHTVTGGSPAMGPSGGFDSSLLMANANYAFTFDEAGSYDYFCMIHPWMVGSVSVN